MPGRSKSAVITSALPYANGEIHLGHIASTYLPADIFTRFSRLSPSSNSITMNGSPSAVTP